MLRLSFLSFSFYLGVCSRNLNLESNLWWQIDPNCGVTFCLGVKAVVRAAGCGFCFSTADKGFGARAAWSRWGFGEQESRTCDKRSGSAAIWHRRARSELTGKDLTKVEDFQT